MAVSAIDQITTIYLGCSGIKEQKILNGESILRINLNLDDLRLWGKASESLPNTNIILACDNDGVEIGQTKLTWVVGAAIRGMNIKSPAAVVELLIQLGSEAAIAPEIVTACPGLCTEISWAFYKERHGWLCASPALNPEQLQILMKSCKEI